MNTASPYNPADQADLDAAGELLAIVKQEFTIKGGSRALALQKCAEWLCRLHNVITEPVTGKLYVYDRLAGFYRATGEEMLRHDMVNALSESINKHGMAEVLAKVRAMSYTELEQLNNTTPPNLIPLSNGVYDLNTQRLLPHSPERFFTYKHPIVYDQNASCPAINKFLLEVVESERERDILLDIAACCLYRARVTRHFYILVGGGHNGKTVYITLIQELLGKGRIVSVTPQALTKDAFASSQLYDKHANLGGDIPGGKIDDASVIKNVTGGDPISVQRKGVDRIDIVPYCELVYSSNDPPQITEDTYAINDRLIPVKFPFTFKENPVGELEKQGTPKEDLYAALLSPKELSGFLNHLLERLPRLVKTGKLSVPIKVEDTRRQYRAISDSLAVFVEEQCEEVEYTPGDTYGPATGYEPADVAYRAYRDWCREHKLKSVSARVFGRDIEATHGFEKGKEQSGKIRSYRGLRIKRPQVQEGQEGHLNLYACSNSENVNIGNRESVLPVLVVSSSPVAFDVLLDQLSSRYPTHSRDILTRVLEANLTKRKESGDIYEPRPGMWLAVNGEVSL